jgi:ferric-dicitrate binding protein FerR (iron transport regulator)
MKPGEMASFSMADTEVNLIQVNTDVYTSWIHNKLVFDNTPVDEAIQSIENYYGVKIEVTSQDVLKQRISGTIRNTDLPTVLKGLSSILGLKIEHKDNIILLNK